MSRRLRLVCLAQLIDALSQGLSHGRNMKQRIGKIELKVGLSPSKKICFVCFDESPLKLMKNAFYFILKPLFVLKIFKLLP